MTFYYDDNRGTQQFNLQDFEPTARQKLSAAISEAWTEGYYDPLQAYMKQREAANIGPKLSAAEASERIRASGLNVKFTARDGEYTAAQLDLMLERQRQIAVTQDVRDRTPWSVLGSPFRGAVMFGTAMADPLNLATAFIPWTRLMSAPTVQTLRSMSTSASLGTRTAGRAALGAADGGISTAVLEPAYNVLRNEIGDDYDALDSMANIAFGTVLGGGIHAIGGAGVDAFRRVTGRAQPWDAAAVPAGERAADGGVAADPAGVPEVRAEQPDILPPSRASEALAAQMPARRNDLMAYIREIGGIDPELARNAGGDKANYINQQLPGTVRTGGLRDFDMLAERMAEDGWLPPGMDATSAEGEAMAADLLERALAGDRIIRPDDMIREAELRAAQEFDEADRDRFEAELEARLEREAIQAENDIPPAREFVDYVSPETREATLAAAVAQSLQGREIDVDAIVRSDPAAGGTATEADMRATGERNQRPEAVRTADFEASAAVDERLATAPKWDTLADAEAAMGDADTLLRDTVKAGDQAFKYSRAASDPTQTPEFKAWFGDSKVVDENGRPLVVYHGTGNAEGLTSFDPSLTGKGNDQLGSGFYFTTKPEEASGYTTAVTQNAGPGATKLGGDSSPGVLPVYLSIKNPLVIQGSSLRDVDIDITLKQALAIIKRAPNIRDLDESPIGNWIDVWSAGKITDKMISEVAQNYTGSSLLSLEGDFFRGDATAFRTALRDFLGYDGVVQDFGDGHKHFVAWFPEQIKSVFNRGTFDPANPNILYARGLTGQSATDALTTSVRASFGDSTDTLLQRGQIQIVATPADIPGGPHPADVKAATAPDGTVYVVAENVSEAEARGIVLHEVGVHVGMREMLGDDVFGAVLQELDDAIMRGESWAQAARAAVPADTLPAHVREEQLAYLVQNAPELPIVQRILAAVRAWAYRTFEFARERMTLTEADFRAMAVAALHHAARSGEPVGGMVPAFSRDVPQTETKAFRDWFGESKVVDENGDPLVVYHGGLRWNAADMNAGGRGALWATDDYSTAAGYADQFGAAEAEIKPLFIKMERPLDLRDKQVREMIWPDDWIREGDIQKDRTLVEQALQYAKQNGFDGMIHPDSDVMNRGGHTSYVVFSDTQIKLAPPTDRMAEGNWFDIENRADGNRGTFDPTNPDIRYSRGPTQDPSTADQILKPYDDAVARAKSYAGVLRAAADKLDNDAQAVAAMRAALPDITEQEIADLLSGLRKQVAGLRGAVQRARSAISAEDTAGVLQSEAMRAADTLANNLQMAAVIERRNAALNLNARLKATTFVNQFRDRGLDAEGFYALLAGSERVAVGSRLSVDAEYKAFRAEWLGGMIADIEKLGYWQHFVDGAFDRDIYDALYRMGSDAPDFTGLAEPAVKIAEVVNKYQTDARNTRNRFGAWIRDLKGYITRQSHDMFKIRAVSDQEWIDAVLPLLDMDKMTRLGLISEQDPIASLRAIYDDLASGSHIVPPTDEADVAAFGSGSNLARRESVSRTLYFKDGVSAFQYNEKFGQGRLADSVVFGLESAARSASLLKTLGTNPEATLTRLMDEYELSLVGDPARRSKFRESRENILNMLKQVDGRVNIPGNVTAAKIGTLLRAWQSLAKLGGAVISSVTDLAGYAAELRYQGNKNLLTGVLDGIARLTQGRAKGEQRQILSSLGVFHESVIGSVAARFDSPELGGKTAAAMNLFFKYNGLNWWTETLRDGAALAHSAYMADNAGKAFDALPGELRRLLELYRIDSGKWDLLRMGGVMQADGRSYMTPDGLRTLPRSALENYIRQAGRTVNDATVQNLIDDLSQAMRAMAIDRAHHAVLEPGARTRAFMLRGSQPGTVPGELLRYIGQFKSFSVAMIQMTLGREIYGRGYDTLGQYLRKGHGDMLGLATYIALTTAMGYAAMAVKDLLKGREPREPQDYRTWMAAMVQGGGLGLYGDFLFGEYSRMGRTLTASLAGPVLGNIDTLADLWTRIRKGDDAAGAAFKALIDNTPFLNLFYIRPALDYLILYQIQEALNPGFLRRMEGRIKRDNGQEFIFPPSQYAVGA